MAKKHIDELTLKEIDYAVAVTQGWKFNGSEWSDKNGETIIDFFEKYQPTTNQAQCGELIDEYFIDLRPTGYKKWTSDYCQKFRRLEEKSRRVCACKAFLWSKYPDGMIPTEETKDE